MFNFVDPAWPGLRLLRQTRQTQLIAGKGPLGGTRCHNSLVTDVGVKIIGDPSNQPGAYTQSKLTRYHFGGIIMSADGNWNLVISTPLGERQAALSVKVEGTVLKGNQAADGDSAEIFDGRVNGDAVSWKVSITNPMPMTLEFSGKVQDDSISGTVVFGAFGASSFSGIRARSIRSPFG
jgi:hypothetical protein